MKRLTLATVFAVLSISSVALAQDKATGPDDKEKQPDPNANPCGETPDPNANPCGETPDPNANPCGETPAENPAENPAEVAAPPPDPTPAPTPAPAPAPAPTPEAAVAATASDASAPESLTKVEKKASEKFFSGGLKIGASLSTVSGDEIQGNELSDYSLRFGPNAGGFLTWRLHENFAVQWEAYFNYKGAKVDGGTFRLNYIDMPILAKGILPMGGDLGITPNVHVGPMISHVQISKVELDEMDREVNLKEDPKSVKTFDLGIAAGIGANYKLPVGEVSGDLRFQQGFSNIIDLENCGSCGNGDTIKNRSFLLMVGYVFP